MANGGQRYYKLIFDHFLFLHLTGKMKRKFTSYFVSQCSKYSHERRESGMERETQDVRNETESDTE